MQHLTMREQAPHTIELKDSMPESYSVPDLQRREGSRFHLVYSCILRGHKKAKNGEDQALHPLAGLFSDSPAQTECKVLSALKHRNFCDLCMAHSADAAQQCFSQYSHVSIVFAHPHAPGYLIVQVSEHFEKI